VLQKRFANAQKLAILTLLYQRLLLFMTLVEKV